MIDWITAQLGRIKTVAIMVLICLAVFFFIGKKIERNRAIKTASENAVLGTTNYLLELDKKNALSRADFYKGRIVIAKERLKQSQNVRNALNLKLNDVIAQRDSLREEINKRPVSVLYDALINDLFPFPGIKKYPFNDLQVENIYLTVQDYRLVIDENSILYKDIAECNNQLTLNDSITQDMTSSMKALEEVYNQSDAIIFNLDQRNELSEDEIKQLKRKLIWHKIGTVLVIAAGIAIAI